VLIPVGRAVIVKPGEITVIERGKYPTEPQRLEDDAFRQYLGGLAFIGAGETESMVIDSPIVAGGVPAPDRIGPVTKSANEPPAARPDGIGKTDGRVPGDRDHLPIPDVGSILQQPPAAITSSGGGGDVGIPF
jgi:hypothetical protein